MTEIKKGNNKFYIGNSEDHPIAEITFINSEDNELIINHTFVSEELRGQKIGKQLVKKVVDYAREEGKKIKPICSFALKEFETNEEYNDVLYKETN